MFAVLNDRQACRHPPMATPAAAATAYEPATHISVMVVAGGKLS